MHSAKPRLAIDAGDWLGSASRATGLLVMCALTAGAVTAQDAPRTAYPREFTGIWTNANLTPVARPRGEERLVVSEEEAIQIASSSGVLGFARDESNYVDRIDPNAPAPAKGASDFGVKGYNSFWLATGDSLARVKGTYRSSNIVDPPNGTALPCRGTHRPRQGVGPARWRWRRRAAPRPRRGGPGPPRRRTRSPPRPSRRAAPATYVRRSGRWRGGRSCPAGPGRRGSPSPPPWWRR
jgi:hypothetical protein